jgi:hypothetical protein
VEFRILEIELKLELFFDSEVIEVAEELIEAMSSRQMLIAITEVVVTELPGDIAVVLQQFSIGRPKQDPPGEAGKVVDAANLPFVVGFYFKPAFSPKVLVLIPRMEYTGHIPNKPVTIKIKPTQPIGVCRPVNTLPTNKTPTIILMMRSSLPVLFLKSDAMATHPPSFRWFPSLRWLHQQHWMRLRR